MTTPKRVAPDHYKRQLAWQIQNHPGLEAYCPVCQWGNSDFKTYKFCPWGHGPQKPIAEYFDDVLGDL